MDQLIQKRSVSNSNTEKRYFSSPKLPFKLCGSSPKVSRLYPKHFTHHHLASKLRLKHRFTLQSNQVLHCSCTVTNTGFYIPFYFLWSQAFGGKGSGQLYQELGTTLSTDFKCRLIAVRNLSRAVTAMYCCHIFFSLIDENKWFERR